MFWADEIARDIVRKFKKKSITLATGITPSGPIHVGNLREVMTADAVRIALEKLKIKVNFLYIADDFDPLRKVYPFLPKNFVNQVNKPLCNIPDPQGKCHKNYAEHFLAEFFESIDKMGIYPKILYASKLYREGQYTKVISEVLKNKNKIKKILSETSGRKIPGEWSPFNPLCKNCGKFNLSIVEQEDLKNHKVFYTCQCGYKGWADYSKGEGKLFWRIDWPARWKFLKVDIEPFGKDHASAGGSFDVGAKIIQEALNTLPPIGIYYEFLYLVGTKGKMSSSLGNVISTKQLLDIVPPEIIRFILLKPKVSQYINFDPGQGLIQTINAFNRLCETKVLEKDEKNFLGFVQGSIKGIKKQIPFVHLANTIQAANFDLKETARILSRTGYKEQIKDKKTLKEQIDRANNWLKNFAPEEIKFVIQEKLPSKAQNLNEKQKELLTKIIKQLNKEISAQELHNFIYESGKKLGLSPADTFKPIYWVLLGKDSGPKAGWFLLILDRNFILKRFKEAIKSS